MQSLPLTFDSPRALVVGLLIAAAGVGVGLYRRPAVPALSKWLAAAAMVLLGVAAGGPTWRRERPLEVAVMVDLSPSTRTARYRDPAALETRVRELVGRARHRVLYFAGGGEVGSAAEADGRLTDISATRTTFTPPATAAVILFSDGRFEVPAVCPPTHVVLDPALDADDDAAVERLEARGRDLVATVRNAGGPRAITWSAASSPDAADPRMVPPGGSVVTRPLPDGDATTVTARLSPGDAWPENDALSIVRPPPPEVQRWWVGRSPPAGDDWRGMSPAGVPVDLASYLVPSVIVLDNIAATELSEPQQQRLRQYVRDLGGGLVILGGDRAYAAGGYGGSVLDSLSPLAGHPADPQTHWVFLIDGSGSMSAAAAGAGGGSRWSAAVGAVSRALPALPGRDLLSIGSFSAGVQWWTSLLPVEEGRRATLPPPGARPSGPTELRRALEAGAVAAGGGPRVELVVLTDANAPVDDPAALAEAFTRANVRLHLLHIGADEGRGLGALRDIVKRTGGTTMRESDPAGWAEAVRKLTRAASPDWLVREPAPVEFVGPLAGTPGRTAPPPWNRTWVKPQAAEAARASAAAGAVAAAATWAVGEGRVVAVGFGAAPADADPFVRLVSRPPRDPRLRVTWDAGPALRVAVDAAAPDAPAGEATLINALPLTLELTDAAGGRAGAATRSAPIPQVAPGRYEVVFDAPAAAALATVRAGGRTVDRAAVAGRYPPEFDRIGNDRAAMRDLAARTGGSIVEPADSRPLRLPTSSDRFALAPHVAAAAAACLAAALVRWARPKNVA